MKKIFKKRSKSIQDKPVRITNETVAEHREKILAGGKRFKYPIQYARHKLVINAITIAVVAFAIIAAIGWHQLYVAQNTSDFMYRVTRVLPLSVATVDGEAVRYSDYLMRYRSQDHWLREKGQIEQGQESGERQIGFIKRSAMDAAEIDAYAAKLGREKGITVTDAEIDEVVKRGLQTANGTISQELYDASTLQMFGYDRSEYRHLLGQSLLRQKVAYAVDDDAKEVTDQLEKTIRSAKDADFVAIAKKTGKGVQAGESGLVRKNNQDGGLTRVALTLKKGKVSTAVQSTTGDGYYFVKLLDVTDTQLSYAYIKVPLTAFDRMFATVKKDGKISEHISLPVIATKAASQ